MIVRDFDEFLIGLDPDARGDGSPDGLKYGDLDAEVRAVGTTWMASMDVLRRAVERGVNLVIAHEPTFWYHGTPANPELAQCERDEVDVSFKTGFLDEHGIAILRAHNNWDPYPEYGIEACLRAVLGLGEPVTRIGDFFGLFEIEPTGLGDLARDYGRRLELACVRVAGDLELMVRRFALAYGASSGTQRYFQFHEAGADAIVCGEAGEWPAIRPALDMGLGVVELGHAATEEFGMEGLARLLREHFPDVPIEHIPAEPSYGFVRP